jgi:hypothetical protein
MLAAALLFMPNKPAHSSQHRAWIATCDKFRISFDFKSREARLWLVSNAGGHPIAKGKIIRQGASDSSRSELITDFALAEFDGGDWQVGLNIFKTNKLYVHRNGKSTTICEPAVRRVKN